MAKMKIKCLGMLLMSIAVYLTIIYVNLDHIVFFFLGSAPLTCALTLCVYAGAVSLLYVAYMGQFRKMSTSKMLNAIALQGLIMFLWFSFINLIQLYPQTIITGVYTDYYWPIDFLPNTSSTLYIVVITAIITVICFLTPWGYKHAQSKKQQQ
jgi:NADH:ubiquinone oxidoreductase subunit 6 (subunit J)